MNYDIASISVEFFERFAIIRGTEKLISWYAELNTFHCKRLWYPVQPLEQVLLIRHDEEDKMGSAIVLKASAAFLAFYPIGDKASTITSGHLDDVLSGRRPEYVFGRDLDIIVDIALRQSPRFRAHRTGTSLVAAFSHQPNDEFRFAGILPTDDRLMQCIEMPYITEGS